MYPQKLVNLICKASLQSKSSNFGTVFFLQCVPAGALPKVATPTGPGGNLAQFLSTPDFEDETQMIEWLILVESRIQPQQMTVGDFRQLRRQQREIQVGSCTKMVL